MKTRFYIYRGQWTKQWWKKTREVTFRMLLQWIFAGQKTATSSGCVRWLEFRISLINIKLFWIQASITAFEKCEPKLSPIKAIVSCMVLAFGKNILRNHLSKVFKSSHALVVQPYTVPCSRPPSTQLLNILSYTYYHWERVRSICVTTKHHANRLLGMFHFFLPCLTITWFTENTELSYKKKKKKI